jgi:hypothetical protein
MIRFPEASHAIIFLMYEIQHGSKFQLKCTSDMECDQHSMTPGEYTVYRCVSDSSGGIRCRSANKPRKTSSVTIAIRSDGEAVAALPCHVTETEGTV